MAVNRSAFDVALAAGEKQERLFAAIFDGPVAYVECKSQVQAVRYRHVYIEHQCRGRPSGIAVTQATHWAIETQPGRWIILPTEALRRLWRIALGRYGARWGGDDMAALGAVIPLSWLL